MDFIQSWIWLIFVAIGLILAMSELLIGVDTGYDLVFLGAAFVVGGLVSWPFHSWVWTLVATAVVCLAYVALGRRYVHKWRVTKGTATNVDAILNRRGVVLRSIGKSADGAVKVGGEEWRARADEDIAQGEEVLVKGVSGVTLIVERNKGEGK